MATADAKETREMTTAAEVKTMVQPLLERNPDLAFAGRMLFVRPVTHIARVIEITRNTGRFAFTPVWGSTFLFFPRDAPVVRWTSRLWYDSLGIWNTTHPDHQRALIETVEANALPVLRKMHTIDDFVAFADSGRPFFDRWDTETLRGLVVCAAKGDREGAQNASDYLLNSKRPREDEGLAEFLLITDSLCPLVAKWDRAGIARLLHEWEAFSVKTFKVEKYWQPTPFPIEMDMALESSSTPPV
ncbi:hypothetical protein [Azorhizobium sp. AG788]|uniref:hypothetical protein n=1 Tax=Azorhizobium sp. AG788 TaxID=2183897 RepID=UPI003138EB27